MTTAATVGDAAASATLARFLVEARWEDVPDDVRHEAKRSILNMFATALAGSRDEATGIAVDVLAGLSGPATATVIGRRERLDPLNAAFLNAAAANLHDFDDTHHPTIIHPTAPVAPALFALAEGRRAHGADLLHAFVLGVEAECRIGNAVSPGHYRRGWHITATCGVFGAAAAVGRILGLEGRRMLWALGNASAQAGGLVETLGTMSKSIGVGNAARGGILAALLAERGFSGPERPLEGPRGFLAVTSDAPDLDAITGGLGERWELRRNTHKPYPCGVVLNPVIDACLEMRNDPLLSPEGIAAITVHGHPLLRERADRPAVTTGREAQVSAQHAVAASLIFGAAGIAEFSDEAVADPRVRALRARVRVADDHAVPVEAARVVVTLEDGTGLVSAVPHGRGTPMRPLADGEIEDKLRRLAAHGCPGLDPSPLIDAVWALDRSPDAGALMALARPPAGG